MVVGPGRIRAILDGIWQPGGLLSQSFALVEIGEKGLTVLTEASCTNGVRASSLGRMKSGESAILCQGVDGVQLGVFDEERRRIVWRWQQALDTRVPVIQSVSYFADYSGEIVKRAAGCGSRIGAGATRGTARAERSHRRASSLEQVSAEAPRQPGSGVIAPRSGHR